MNTQDPLIQPEQLAAFREHRLLTTEMIEICGIAARDGEEGADEICAARERLSALVRVFVEQVWKAGLKKEIDASPERGLSSSVEGLNMLTYALAGRIMVTLNPSSGDEYVSMLGYTGEGEDGMYLRGVFGEEPKLAALITLAIEKAPLLRQCLEPDRKVGLAIP